MELLLNIFWLLIAAGALGIWIRQWRRGARRRDLPLQLFALGCVLVFLLPVISASDDFARHRASRRSLGFLPQNTEEHHAERGIGPHVAARDPGRAIAGVVLSGSAQARRCRY